MRAFPLYYVMKTILFTLLSKDMTELRMKVATNIYLDISNVNMAIMRGKLQERPVVASLGFGGRKHVRRYRREV